MSDIKYYGLFVYLSAGLIFKIRIREKFITGWRFYGAIAPTLTRRRFRMFSVTYCVFIYLSRKRKLNFFYKLG